MQNKKRRIENEVKRLNNVFSHLNSNQKKANRELIRNLAFTSIMLQDLQKEILKAGVKEVYVHGENQSGYKESIESKTYNTMVKNFITMIRTLNTLLPEEEKVDPDAEFDNIAGDYK